MKQHSLNRVVLSYVEYIVIFILILLPFHATLTVWLSRDGVHYTLLRLWKEILILGIFFPLAWTALKDKQVRKSLLHSWLNWLIIAYIALHLVIGLVALADHQLNIKAFGHGIVLNLRLVGFFWVCLVLGAWTKKIHKYWAAILLLPAAVVVGFGLLQHYVLPANFLTHLGYGVKTITPYQLVDLNPNFVRIQSTTRGPNPLGAYLVIIITVLIVLIFYAKKLFEKIILTGSVIASSLALFYSYSRSAWAGTVLSGGLSVWVLISKKARIVILLLGAAVIAGGTVAYSSLKNNNNFQDTVLHTSKATHSPRSSNQGHQSAFIGGLKDIKKEPLGRGPGTAGPASLYNNHPGRIAENYYIQLGQEVGVEGLAIFVAINVLVGVALWKNRKDPLALTLLASLVGVSLINMLSHAWTDDMLSLIWWGLAGIAVSPVIIKTKAESQNETKTPKKKTTLRTNSAD